MTWRPLVLVVALAVHPAAAAEFLLVISGTPALAVSGECSVLAATGNVQRREFSTLVPKTYAIEGEAVSCTVRNGDPFGRVAVTLQRDRVAVARAETASAYSWVEVRSQGPWGRASGFRGDPPQPRAAPRRTPRPQPLPPPLTGPLPPPLQAPANR